MQTQKYVPEKYINFIVKNKELNPNFQYIFWDELKILELIKNNEDFMNTYYSFNYMHQKIDFARYIILYTFGGVFIDMDAFTVQNLEKLFEIVEDFDVVLSLLNLNTIESYFTCGKTKCVNNGIILSSSKNDFLLFVINYIINNKKNNINIIKPKEFLITATTGPLFLNNILNKYNGNSKIKILDYEYLEPCIRNFCNETKNTYIKHTHGSSWINNKMILLFELYWRNKKIVYIVFVLIFILLLSMIYKYVLKNKN